jgi:hypothetical protein
MERDGRNQQSAKRGCKLPDSLFQVIGRYSTRVRIGNKRYQQPIVLYNRTELLDGKAPVGRINAILVGIERVTLESVFLEWMERLRRYIDTNGDYVDSPISLRQ